MPDDDLNSVSVREGLFCGNRMVRGAYYTTDRKVEFKDDNEHFSVT